MKNLKKYIITGILSLCLLLISGCSSLETTLTNEAKVQQLCTSFEWTGYNGTKLCIGFIDTNKQEEIANYFIIVAEAIQIAANAENIEPTNINKAIENAIKDINDGYKDAIMSAINLALSTYKIVYDNNIGDKLQAGTIQGSLRLLLISLSSGIQKGALTYIPESQTVLSGTNLNVKKARELDTYTLAELTFIK